MSPDARGRISEAATCPLVLLNAADFGHVHRSRLHWGLSSERLIRRGGDTAIDVHVSGRFLTFTTVFLHPPDRPGATDEAAKHRFQADGRRFPLARYVKHNLVWARDASRPLLSMEREQLMGFLVDYTNIAGRTKTQGVVL
eukprot:4646098-Amphidinium_carterae.6